MGLNFELHGGPGTVPTCPGRTGTVWGGGRGLWNPWHPPGSEGCFDGVRMLAPGEACSPMSLGAPHMRVLGRVMFGPELTSLTE